MKTDCLVALEELIVNQIPGYILSNRKGSEPLFVARLNFYDTHAPRCYFAFDLTCLETAKKTIAPGHPHRFNKLWATAETTSDEYLYFPETIGDDFAAHPILDACYRFLCDDENPESYRQYANAICCAALRINSNIRSFFPGECETFNLVPADDSFEFLGDDEAIRLSVPPKRIETLIEREFLDGRDEHFGIYPKDIYCRE